MMYTYGWFLRWLCWWHWCWWGCMDWFVAGDTTIWWDCWDWSHSTPYAVHLATRSWWYKAVVVPTITTAIVYWETAIWHRHWASACTCSSCDRCRCFESEVRSLRLDDSWCLNQWDSVFLQKEIVVDILGTKTPPISHEFKPVKNVHGWFVCRFRGWVGWRHPCGDEGWLGLCHDCLHFKVTLFHLHWVQSSLLWKPILL